MAKYSRILFVMVLLIIASWGVIILPEQAYASTCYKVTNIPTITVSSGSSVPVNVYSVVEVEIADLAVFGPQETLIVSLPANISIPENQVTVEVPEYIPEDLSGYKQNLKQQMVSVTSLSSNSVQIIITGQNLGNGEGYFKVHFGSLIIPSGIEDVTVSFQSPNNVFSLATDLVIAKIFMEDTNSKGSISGQILDYMDNPVANRDVVAKPVNGSSSKTASTNSDGYYTIKNLASGEYDVYVSLTNFHYSSNVSVTSPNDTANINIKLARTIDEAKISPRTWMEPVSGAIPVEKTIMSKGFEAKVVWNGNPSIFEPLTIYTATITIMPCEFWTLKGVGANFFEVPGVTTSNAADSGIVTAIFSPTASYTDATLSDLWINGSALTSFDSNTFSYNVVLPAGTHTIPDVSAFVKTVKAKAVITEPISLPGSAQVLVTAEGGATTTYTINFTVLQNVTVAENSANVNVNTNPLQITVPAGVNNATLTTTPLNGVVTIPQVSVQSTTSQGNVNVSISDGTQITGPASWNGTINLPKVINGGTTLVTPSNGYTASVSEAIEVGLPDTALTFSQPVRLLLAGQGGKKAGWYRNGSFTPINYQMTSDATDSLGANNDGYITLGNDLVIWTKHFTTFIAYTETAISSDGSGGGGGGSGVVIITPIIKTAAATSITTNSAVLNGELKKGDETLDYGFLWGTSSSSLTNKLVAGKSNHNEAFSTNLSELAANQRYYFQTYVTNSTGTVKGNVLSFTTLSSQNTEMPTVPATPAESFSDVTNSHWGYNAISSLRSKGLIFGYPDGTFKPDTSITRAEFVTMLVKALGLNTSVTSSMFKDVTADAWYYGTVNTATSAGLVSGMGDNLFAPNTLITREQMAMMVVHSLGSKAPIAIGNELENFSDKSTVSSWAVSSMRVAVKAGIINGMSTGKIAPLDNATRAQAAEMISNMLYVLSR